MQRRSEGDDRFKMGARFVEEDDSSGLISICAVIFCKNEIEEQCFSKNIYNQIKMELRGSDYDDTVIILQMLTISAVNETQ